MSLKLYDTLTKEKQPFRPLDPNNVRMYVCGPTVYDFAHIGNARPVIVFDVLFRLLRHVYGEKHVTYVRNITDVDDKINARAAERGHVGVELRLGLLGDAADRLVQRKVWIILRGAGVDLVVDVGDVADIGDVLRPVEMAEQPEQHVEDDDWAGVADMGEVIDRRPAHIHPHPRGIDRREQALRARQGVV